MNSASTSWSASRVLGIDRDSPQRSQLLNRGVDARRSCAADRRTAARACACRALAPLPRRQLMDGFHDARGGVAGRYAASALAIGSMVRRVSPTPCGDYEQRRVGVGDAAATAIDDVADRVKQRGPHRVRERHVIAVRGDEVEPRCAVVRRLPGEFLDLDARELLAALERIARSSGPRPADADRLTASADRRRDASVDGVERRGGLGIVAPAIPEDSARWPPGRSTDAAFAVPASGSTQCHA